MDYGVSGRTIREVYLAAAKVMFAWAVENRKLTANPATGVSVRVPKRVRSRGPSFTALEVRTILSGSLVMDQGRVSPSMHWPDVGYLGCAPIAVRASARLPRCAGPTLPR